MNKYYFDKERLFNTVPKDKLEQLKVDIEIKDNLYIEENYLKISCPFKKAKNGYREFVNINEVEYRQTFFKILNFDISYFKDYKEDIAKYKVDEMDKQQIADLQNIEKTKRPNP